MRVTLFEKLNKKYKLKKWANKGTFIAFMAGWLIAELFNKVDEVLKKDPTAPQPQEPPQASETIDRDKTTLKTDDEIIDEAYSNADTDVELTDEDYKYFDLKPSGNSEYGKFQGVDISNTNGEVNIAELKANGVDFVIIRAFDCWEMDYENDHLRELDLSWEKKVQDCIDNDMPFGIYIYSRATTEEMAEQEAVKLIKFLSMKGIRPDFPIFWDIEDQDTEPLKKPTNETVNARDFVDQNREQVVKNFKAFARVMEKYGYYVGIYTSDSVLCKIDPTGEELKDYAVWDSAWRYGEGTSQMDFYYDFNPITPDYPHIDMYQFSSTGHLPGVNGGVDCDLCKYNYAEIIHRKGLNIPVDYDLYFGNDPTYKEIVDGEYPKTKTR